MGAAAPNADRRVKDPRPTLPSSSSSSSSSGGGGSTLLSLRMAEALVRSVGGRVSVSHQVPMVNAMTDRVDSATCIEVLLPAPAS